MRKFSLLIFVIFILPVANALADATIMEIIPLKYYTAEQIIPTLKPMLHRDGAVTGIQNKLILRTTPENMVSLKQLITQVDAPRRRLLITVKQGARLDDVENTIDVAGDVRIGNRTRVIVPSQTNGSNAGVTRSQNGNSVRAKVLSRTDNINSNNTQQIQTLEGSPAFIRVGESVPIAQRSVNVIGNQVIYSEGSEYKDVTTGFYVVPRINGDTYTLEISPHKNTLTGGVNGSINVQQLNTVVSGKLGEWMDIGGAAQTDNRSGSGTVYSTRTSRADERNVLIKVDEIR